MPHRFSFEAIGTHWVIDIFQDISVEKTAGIESIVRERIERFESTYSRFRSDSWLSNLSKAAGRYPLPEDATPLFSMYQSLYQLTGGLVTPLIGQALSDAGYDKGYSFTQVKELTAPPAWGEVMDYDPTVTPPTLTIKKPAAFDVGALGKGYIIDLVADLLEQNDIPSYCVDAGGDMKQRSDKSASLRIALEDPQDATKAIGVMELGDASIAGSAGNRRKWGKFNHILNPKSLVSPDHVLGVWVVADSTMLADAMTTALYFCPAETLLKTYSFKYLIIHADRSVEGNLLVDPMLKLA